MERKEVIIIANHIMNIMSIRLEKVERKGGWMKLELKSLKAPKRVRDAATGRDEPRLVPNADTVSCTCGTQQQDRPIKIAKLFLRTHGCAGWLYFNKTCYQSSRSPMDLEWLRAISRTHSPARYSTVALGSRDSRRDARAGCRISAEYRFPAGNTTNQYACIFD